MKRTYLGLSALMMAGAIVVACSSSSTTTESTPDAGMTATDSGGGSKTDVTPGDTDSGATCPLPVTDSEIIAWKSPKAQSKGACSQSDIDALNTKLNDDNATFMDIYNAASAGCQSCVFSSQNDANWQVIVWSPDMASGNAIYNYGACYAAAPGGNMACGQIEENDQQCFDAACPSDTCTDSQTCVDDAASGDCAKYDMGIAGACGAATSTLDNECGDVLQAIQFLCGDGTFNPDGGADASDDGG